MVIRLFQDLHAWLMSCFDESLRSFVMARFVGLVAVFVLAAGCSQSNQQTGDVSESTTPVSFNTAGAPTVEFSVPDMMCPEGCGAKVKEILAGQPGAKDVLVDFPAKTAKVAVDKDKFDAVKAVAALKDYQFKNSALKDAGATAATSSSATTDAKSIQ
jgi:copper chaperone CopZ